MAVFENTTPVPIPDNDQAGAYSDLSVSTGEYVTVFSVHIEITHTYISDLDIWLIRPDGQSYHLWQQEGGSADDISATYDLPDLIGFDVTGVWRLHAVDNYGGDSGTIESWSITTASVDGLFSRMEDAVGDFVSPLIISGAIESTVSCSADIAGVIPAVAAFEATAGATMLATGLAGIDLISTARPRELYRCYIESASEGEIEIPISSATIRQNAGGTGYVQVSMPDYRLVSALIARAADGKLRIDYVLEKEGREQATPFARTDAVTVTQEQGSRNRSITIAGQYTLPAQDAKTLALEGVSYISDNGSTRRVRCQHNPRVAVGDTVYATTLPNSTVQSTVLTLNTMGKQFEVTV